jgi:S-DNA-T family DNA segregation ATPase FtsK/SpoIIIE
VEELDILSRWSRACSFKSVAAPIGIRENGEVFEFDIHEKKHGPHGIVAGTSGSGKSEALTTWILSIALNFHPNDVSFALIDFKGDGLAGILKSLPHVAGVISNVNDAGVIERNIRSLYGEIKRRELVFEAAGINNIHKYQEARGGGRDMAPMPYLIVVIDEFAEMKTQFPDQMSEFVSIARTGRSLGVYMVLSMQSPGGVVTGQVEANSRFRICLRTANSGESKEILGTADAYQIRHPGRAYVKVGAEVYEQVQTFYSKALYRPDTAAKGPPTKINIVEADGERVRPEVYEKTLRLSGGETEAEEEGRAVARYVNDTAAQNGIRHTRQVWTELLPERLFLSALTAGREAFRDGAWEARSEGLAVIAGLVDDPDGQRQYPLVLDFMRDGHQVLYGAPSTGKTTFLQTVIASAAMTYTPDQLQFLILDFGTWGLKIFERLPHSLLAVDANDSDNVKRAEKYMLAEIERRKRLFSGEGVGTLEAYREVTGQSIPAVVIVIDNMASLYNMYQDMLDSLITVAREGGGMGVYLLVTAGSPGSFMFRIAQYVKAAYALQLTDKSDYRALVGGNGRMEPTRFPGRGFTKGPLEFQTALCVDGATEGVRVKQLRAMCDAMSETWKGTTPSLTRLSSDAIDADTLSFSADSVQIGLDKNTAAPYEFVFADMNGCVITGPPSSGKTNFMGLLVRALAGDGNTELRLYEKGSVLEGLCVNAAARVRVARDGGVFDAMMDEIADEFDRRSDGADAAPRIVICVDDFIQFYSEISDESAEKLARVASYGEEYGFYVYITGETDGITYFHNNFVKAFENCLAYGNAVALSGRLKSFAVFDKLCQTDGDLAAGDNEGFVIHAGSATPVRAAKITAAVTADA